MSQLGDEMNDKLTPEQIENWRKILCISLGAYALIMSPEQIQQYKDRLQALANYIPEDSDTKDEMPVSQS